MRDEIISYWFSNIGNGFDIEENNRLWYSGSISIDQQICDKFGDLVAQALNGELQSWSNTIEGALALVILLDQFPRNIYRGTAKAFSGDSQARKIVKKGLSTRLNTQLTFMQRCFFYMPLEHSESLLDQQQSVELFKQLLEEVPEQGKEVVSASLRYAIHHCEIIEQFGRFPHRNQVLGRVSTADELRYLQQGGARFGQ